MGTPFNAVYQRFLQKVSDFKLLELPEEDMQDILYGYMVSAISKQKRCKSDLSKRSKNDGCFEDELLDIEIEILALQMVCEWIEPQLNSELYVKQFIGTKEEKFYAQANQIEKLQALRDSAELRSRKLRRDYSYQHTTYFNR